MLPEKIKVPCEYKSKGCTGDADHIAQLLDFMGKPLPGQVCICDACRYTINYLRILGNTHFMGEAERRAALDRIAHRPTRTVLRKRKGQYVQVQVPA